MKLSFLINFNLILMCLYFNPIVCNYCGANSEILNTHKDGYKLKSVQVMTRHGDRVPIYTFPYGTKGNAEWECPIEKIENFSNDISNKEILDRIYRKIFLNDREPYKGNCRLGSLYEKKKKIYKKKKTFTK